MGRLLSIGVRESIFVSLNYYYTLPAIDGSFADFRVAYYGSLASLH